jgi:phospholipid/cholesterol/gamma-HCH transport system permease protein
MVYLPDHQHRTKRLSESVIKLPVRFLSGAVSMFGRWTLGFQKEVKSFFQFLKEVLHWTFRKPFRVNLLFQQLEFVGNQSLNILMISGLAVGAVFGLQIGAVFQVFRAESLMGAATAKALCQELAPLITAILLTGRAGSAMTAEISTMKVNEQVDAMEAMAVDPVSYLVVPRFLAAIIIIPMLCAVFIFIGVIGAYIAGVVLFNVDQGLFVEKLTAFVTTKDMWRGLIKSFAFSGIMAVITCKYGLNAKGGAKGVGIATTNSVVVTLLVVLFVDVVITYFQIVW